MQLMSRLEGIFVSLCYSVSSVIKVRGVRVLPSLARCPCPHPMEGAQDRPATAGSLLLFRLTAPALS